MKKKDTFWTYIALVLSVVSVCASLYNVDMKAFLSIDWNILGWILAGVTIFLILSFVMTTYLMMQRHRILNIYLSSPQQRSNELKIMKDALFGENVTSLHNLAPGTNKNEIIKLMKRSHFCFFMVSEDMSKIQKEEMKEMKHLKKKIYVVSLDNEGNVPQELRSEVPLYIKDENFVQKVKDILMEYK